MSIVQLTERYPAWELLPAMGLRRARYRSTWPSFRRVEIIPSIRVEAVQGDDPSLLWMPDSLSDRLRTRGVKAVSTSGVVLPADVPTDGTDLDGAVRRAFLDGLAYELWHLEGLSNAEIAEVLGLMFPTLSATGITRAWSAG